MDFIFFAVNASALGLSVLLLLNHFQFSRQRKANWLVYGMALATTAVYYLLNQLVFSRILVLYLLANLLPIVVLVVVALVVFRRHEKARR